MRKATHDSWTMTNTRQSISSMGDICNKIMRFNLFILIIFMMLVSPSGVLAADAPEANPWASGEPASSSTPSTPVNTDWLTAAPTAPEPTPFDWLHPFQETLIPLNVWVDQGLDWLVDNFRPVFQAIRWPIDAILTSVESTLLAAPALLIILIFVLLAWQMVGCRLAVGTLISLVIVGLIGAWSEAMVTLALVLTSVFFCILVGLPLGIWLARNDRALAIFRPILDAMQTTPAFVYLVPIVMLFGIGNVPGVVVTIILRCRH